MARAFATLIMEKPSMASMRMDNALSLLEANGIEARWSNPYKPIANGVAERAVGETNGMGSSDGAE